MSGGLQQARKLGLAAVLLGAFAWASVGASSCGSTTSSGSGGSGGSSGGNGPQISGLLGKLDSVRRSTGRAIVKIEVGDNLTAGMVRDGIKLDAARAFKYVHDHYPPTRTVVDFYTELVNKETGRTSHDLVAIYTLSRARERQIDWSNTDAIDWDTYRRFLHPAMG